MSDLGQEGGASSDPQSERVVNTCPSCRRALDVTDHEPFAKIACPVCGEPMRVRTRFNQFKIVRQIGEGGMSRVFLAEDVALGRMDALKILHRQFSKDPERTRQFEREAKITASISHPNVVKVYSVGRDQGYFYIAMELVGNGSMDELIRKEGGIGEERLLSIGIEVAKGLRAAHKAGLIHRDVKPGNILFAQDGVPKIVDFGLALVLEQDVDDSAEIWATPYYVPPEKLDHAPEDFRGDIYSLGASLFHGLAGRPPFAADTASIAELKRLKAKPISLREAVPDVSEATCAVVDRAMAYDPRERHHSYDELIAHLQYALKCVRRGVTGRGWRSQRDRRRSGLITALAFGAGGAAGVALLVATWGDREGPGDTGGNGPGPRDSLAPQAIQQLGGGTVSERFVNARRALAAGESDRALAVFEDLAEASDVVQPTRNWARYHAGFARLLRGEKEAALPRFNELSATGRFSDDQEDAELADFFVALGRTVATGMPPGTDVLEEAVWSTGPGPAGLPVFGLLHWLDGNAESAVAFFRRFASSNLSPEMEWLGEYRELFEPYLHDADVLSGLPRLPETLGDLNAAARLRETWAAGIERLRVENGASADALRRFQGFAGMLSAAKAAERTLFEMERGDAEERELDELRALLADTASRRAAFDFDAVAAGIRGGSRTTEMGQTVARDVAWLFDLAEGFIDTLVRDLNQKRFAGQISVPSGTGVLRGEVTAASRDQVRVSSGAGDAAIELGSIPLPVFLHIAGEILATVSDSKDYYLRREQMVAFAQLTGFAAFAQPAAEELAREFPPFGDVWKRLVAAGLVTGP